MNSGNSPMRFDTRISTAKDITTGKYFNPCGPMMSWIMLRTANTLTSSVCCPPPGSDSDNFPLKIQMMTTLRMQAMKNITVYHGIAFSAVYGPNTSSGFAPNFPSNLSQIGLV